MRKVGHVETERDIEMRGGCERQRAPNRLKVFYLDCSGYSDIGGMLGQCQHCSALCWSGKRMVSSIDQYPQFSTSCQNTNFSIHLHSDPPPLLRQLLAVLGTYGRRLRQNIRKNNSALSMGAVIANWMNRGPGTSPINPKFTLQGQMYHYI